jgi:hypothetical protein
MKALAGSGAAATISPTSSGASIVICAFAAAPRADSILLTWETCCEWDTVGFHLYRSDEPGAEPVRINDRLIPAKYPGQLIGAIYYYTDANVEAGHMYFYWLDTLDCSGLPTRHGPIDVTTYFRVYMPLVQRICALPLAQP